MGGGGGKVIFLISTAEFTDVPKLRQQNIGFWACHLHEAREGVTRGFRAIFQPIIKRYSA